MFAKVSKSLKACMVKQGGYRERDIVKNAQCYTVSNKSKRLIKVHKKPARKGWRGATAVFDTKTCRWVN